LPPIKEIRDLKQLQAEVQQLRAEINALKGRESRKILELRGVLKRRGLELFRRNPTQHLLFPAHFPPSRKDRFYELFQKYSFRLFLREILIHRGRFRIADVVRFSNVETGRRYLRALMDLDLAEPAARHGYRLRHPSPSSLGPTLEWFLAEVLRREFFCPAFYGLRCRGTRFGGDYDVVALVEGWLVYIEVKSSPPKNIEGGEIQAFLTRLQDLLPQIAFFFVDTELRLRDKIIPLFETEIFARGASSRKDLLPVEKIGDEIFLIPPRIYVLNSKRSIVKNIAACFRHSCDHHPGGEGGPSRAWGEKAKG
jgi:hypothetical protein